jgi:hypothetical protein
MQATEQPTSATHRITAYHCDVCDANFPNEGALRSHQKMQHGEAPNPQELQYTAPDPEREARPSDHNPLDAPPDRSEPGARESVPDESEDEEMDQDRAAADRYDQQESLPPPGSRTDPELTPQEDRDPAPSRRGESEREQDPFEVAAFVRSNRPRESRSRASPA